MCLGGVTGGVIRNAFQRYGYCRERWYDDTHATALVIAALHIEG